MRKHLVDLHSGLAKHFARCCGIHKSIAEEHTARTESLPDGAEKTHHDIMGKCHGKMAAASSAKADFHVEKAMEVSTTNIDVPTHETNRGGHGGVHTGDLEGPAKVLSNRERFTRAVDDGVHGAIPDNGSREHLTLVPRPGGYDPNDPNAEAIAKVPEQFRKLVTREV